jgi:hypothetical protein
MDSKSTTKNFPGFDKLFLWTESGGSRAFRGKLGLSGTNEDSGLHRAEIHPNHPIQVQWVMGGAQPVEVIWTTSVAPIIVADSVVQLLRSHGFTGWSLYDVTVHGKQGEPIPGYHGLAITGRCGEIDWSKGIEEPRVRPAGIFPVWRGLFFDPASWDGSDFFVPTNGNYVCVVEAVKKAVKKAKVRNVVFKALDQFERSWKL